MYNRSLELRNMYFIAICICDAALTSSGLAWQSLSESRWPNTNLWNWLYIYDCICKHVFMFVLVRINFLCLMSYTNIWSLQCVWAPMLTSVSEAIHILSGPSYVLPSVNYYSKSISYGFQRIAVKLGKLEENNFD